MTTDTSTAAGVPGTPTLAEDLLLLLFQPDSGTIAGENTLFYVLGAAMLADLALHGSVMTTATRDGSVAVEAVEGREPSDEIFHSTWDYVSDRRRGVQTLLPAVGPKLRQPLLSRLIARGDIRKEKRKALGLFTTTALVDGGNGRRAGLLENVRNALVDYAEPTPRVTALAALVWGSGTLPQFDPVIPWNSSVIARAKELERGNWGAAAAGEAVTRTMTAIIVNSVLVAAAVPPPQ
ncbi:MAG TPA: GPP34 family phosphoprotein [Planctomycetaceae bacterium]|jgi:hypothetical protein|nr:GPP34 family phosphoprotein [Planctomycetaceae bacterium]